MRFMVLVKGDPGVRPPSREAAAAMGRYLDDLNRAGVLLAAEALHPSAAGSRLRVTARERTRIDGPFDDPSELVVGSVLRSRQVRARKRSNGRRAVRWTSRSVRTRRSIWRSARSSRPPARG